MFRTLALSEVAQADLKIRAKPESPFFTEGKFPLTSMGVLPDYKIKKLAPNDASKGGFTHGTQLSHVPDLQDSIILLLPISELTKRAKVRIIPLLWEVRLKCEPYILHAHAQLTAMSLFSEGKL